jgi:hypothetical protein
MEGSGAKSEGGDGEVMQGVMQDRSFLQIADRAADTGSR